MHKPPSPHLTQLLIHHPHASSASPSSSGQSRTRTPGSPPTTPPSSTTAGCVLANVTQISYTGLSTRDLTTTSSAQSSGTYRLVLDDLTLSSTGTVGPFRYIYLYNTTPTSPADPLIGYFDYGANLTLNTGESLTIDFDQASGAITLG